MKEKKIKILWSLVMVISLLLCGGGTGYAAVSGVCSECHTMHSSQTPSPTDWTNNAWTPGQTPNVALLAASTGCLGCHQAASGVQNTGSNNIPYVHQVSDPSYGDNGTAGDTLAGGTFYYMGLGGTADLDAKGHNVLGISTVADGQLTNEPPGYDSTLGNSLGLPSGTWSANRLTCAGSYGCHGDHSESDQFAALAGGHHGDDSSIDGLTIPTSYRFLLGILGKEWNTSASSGGRWEYKPTDSAHNQYKGTDRSDDTYSTGTISYLCAQCHGFFHSSDNTSGSTATGGIDDGTTWGNWVRHPTDYDMGNKAAGTEYRTYNADGSTYSVVAPVASNDVDSVVSSVTFADDTIVTCISCHRAHGSNFADLLRWDYSGMVANTTGSTAGTGCFICHTAKDGS